MPKKKRFDCSLDTYVDQMLWRKGVHQSLEDLVLQCVADAKAAEIYRNSSWDTRDDDEEEEEQQQNPSRPMRLKSGEDLDHEEKATEILVASRRAEGKGADRREWLTHEQIALRQHREVYNQNGFPDAALVSGIYKRAHNPNAGSRPNKFHKSDE